MHKRERMLPHHLRYTLDKAMYCVSATGPGGLPLFAFVKKHTDVYQLVDGEFCVHFNADSSMPEACCCSGVVLG